MADTAPEAPMERYHAAFRYFITSGREAIIIIGGGTPSLLEEEAIERIIGKLNNDFIFCKTPEITIEANPGTVTRDKLRCWKRIGINRLSIGLQSADASASYLPFVSPAVSSYG